MDDSIQTEQTIIIDGNLNLEDYKIYWRDIFIRDLPNTVIFWGTLAGGAMLLAFVFRDNLFGFSFLLFSLLIAAIPVLMIVYNYRSFMSVTKKYIASLSELERHFNIIIKPDGNGIECMQGENFAFISWESIRGVFESEEYFTLEYRTTPFLIMKREFNDKSDIRLFRNMLAAKFGAKAKLLQ
jgi:hypothetical protein